MGGCLWGDLRVDALLGGAKIVELNTDRDIFGLIPSQYAGVCV